MIDWNEAPEGAERFSEDFDNSFMRIYDNCFQYHYGVWTAFNDQHQALEYWDKATPRPEALDHKPLTKELVKNPSHYDIIDDFTALEMIARSSTVEEFRGFCKGNIIKYRMRVGKKDDVTQEVAKAENYKLIYEDNKHLCYDYVAAKS
jgi:hypothetical protein